MFMVVIIIFTMDLTEVNPNEVILVTHKRKENQIHNADRESVVGKNDFA